MFSDSVNSFKEFHDQYYNLIAFGGAKEKKEKEYEKGYKILEQYCKKKGILKGKQIKADEEIIKQLLKETELSYINIAEILEISRATIYEIEKKVRNNI